MNRRDFLRLGVAGVVGAMFPKWGTERINMPIGDVLAKQARGEQLNGFEIEQIRQWGNQLELQSAFVGGTQTGQADMNAREVRALTGDFEIPPLNGCYFGRDLFFVGYDQAITTGGTVLTDAFKLEYTTPESIVVWYDQTNGHFQINPRFAVSTPRVIEFSGHFYTEANVTLYGGILWRRKSDDSQFGSSGINFNFTGSNAMKMFSFVVHHDFSQFDEDIATLYFEIVLTPGTDTNVLADMFVKRVL